MTPRVFAGQFDPKFLGITIRARTATEVESFRLQATSRYSPLEILEELADDAAISDVSRASVIQHEIRHFHDSLLFPFGAATIRARIHAVHNGFVTSLKLKKLKAVHGDANAIVVPFQQWLFLSEEDREAFLQQIRRSTGRDLRVPVVPIVSEADDLSDLPIGAVEPGDDAATLVLGCRITLVDYGLLERYWTSPHMPGDEIVLAAVDIWEVSGLACQAAAIAMSSGSNLMQRFLNWIRANGPRSYQRGFDAIEACLEALGWHLTLRNILALSTWAQMGAYQTETTDSSPASRLLTLIRAAKGGGRWSADSTFRDLVAAWDELTGIDSFTAIAVANETFARFVDKATLVGKGMYLLPPELLTGLQATRIRTAQAFLADPDRYVDPMSYLGDDDVFLKPSVGVQYPINSGLRTDWVDVTPSDWVPLIDFDENLSLVALADLSDAIFLPGEKSLEPSAREKIHHVLDLESDQVHSLIVRVGLVRSSRSLDGLSSQWFSALAHFHLPGNASTQEYGAGRVVRINNVEHGVDDAVHGTPPLELCHRATVTLRYDTRVSTPLPVEMAAPRVTARVLVWKELGAATA